MSRTHAIRFIHPDIGFDRFSRIPPLTYPVLAALTPPEWSVGITDAGFESIDYDEAVDIVGVTATISNVNQVYRIAKRFRERGVTTIMGGPYATLCPEDALAHVDCVFVGEAELTWPEFLEDFERGTCKRIYRARRPVRAEEIPQPRRELLNPKGYHLVNGVMATRGCVHGCEFCTVKDIYPLTRYTKRSVPSIIEEIENSFIGSFLQKRFFVFLEDNLVGDRKFALELFRSLVPLKKTWYSLAPLHMANDRELLRLAAASGCRGIEVGLESFNPEVLKSQNKPFNHVEQYRDQISRFHDHGIGVQAIMIVGFDQDTKETFKRTLDALIKINVDVVAPLTLIPYPNTDLYRNMEREGRILTKNLDLYDGAHVVYRPMKMTPDELIEQTLWLVEQFYSYKNMFKRWPLELRTLYARLPLNLSLRNQFVGRLRRAQATTQQARSMGVESPGAIQLQEALQGKP